jgi:5-methylcytosine-specific restriction endonuclease McrA
MSDGTAATIAFAEKVLLLLDQGSFTATYKFAVLLAMIDLCLERAATDGRAPDELDPHDLAEKTIELYWPQTAWFPGADGAVVLRQNSGGQAAIISAIRRFRERLGDTVGAPGRARRLDPGGFDELACEVEWKLIQMPLPRLQILGGEQDRFLYDIAWDVDVRRGAIADGAVDTNIRLRPQVGERLVRLSGLLRPLVQRQWAERVARFNRRDVAEFELEEFLFGVPRLAPARLVDGLRELQRDACFYCDDRLAAQVEVDHFIPWARHPDDGVHNLVLAHRRCNGAKRDFLAATDHVERWDARFASHGSELERLADEERWASHPTRTHSVVRAIYLRLRDDARLWLLDRSFVPPDLPRLRAVLTGLADAAPAAAEEAETYRDR